MNTKLLKTFKSRKLVLAQVFILVALLILAFAAVLIPQRNVRVSEARVASSYKSISNERLEDKRVRILRAYLESKNSPMVGEAEAFVEAADTYGVDWKLVPAITGVESTFGKFVPGSYERSSYNGWGWGVYGTQAIYFDSWREGIFTVTAGLKKNYIDKGLTDPYAMNKVYAASPAWGWKVAFFMNDITKYEASYLASERVTPNSEELKIETAGQSGQLEVEKILALSI